MNVDGLVKLVSSEGYSTGRYLVLDLNNRQNSNDPYWKVSERIWMPKSLVRTDNKKLKILTTYQPIYRRIPRGSNEETLGEFSKRIAIDTKTLSQYLKEDNGGKNVNAYNLSNLSLEPVLSDPARECLPLFGLEGLINNPNLNFEVRYTLLTTFFEVNE